LHQPKGIDPFEINQKTLFSCDCSGSTSRLLAQKKLCCISYATDYENYNLRFQFFRFSPPPTHFALAPPLSATNTFEKITETGDGGLGAEPPAAGSQRGFVGGAPNAAAIFQLFSKNKAFLCIFWYK